ncbi:hypothetical protein [Roseateles oligotrophus]|uniref:ABC transporter substrate-binding protein n=1 Tax=Roseateles oligotrophus TaxID=1769250 RepID=A0ABT2YKB1_9BURK|nr:hypothetical protein [Roseateles oligotrophus]MCV2370505.1 hypothetical protein [Roseateles oligotrophus]
MSTGLRLAFALACAAIFPQAHCNALNPAWPDKFVLGTNSAADVFTGLWERLVYAEAFKRMGVQLEMVVAPLKRIEMMLERGEIDGETMRGPAYGALHPELILVDLPLMPVLYGFYALNPVAGLARVEDLRSANFRGAYRRGVIYCQNALSPLMPTRRLDAVTTVKQGIGMLQAGHADFFCDVNMGILNHEYSAAGRSVPKLQKLFDISAPVSNGGYLHAKHAVFGMALAVTLKQMEKEGLFEKYRLETMARLSPRND